uniref:UORF2 n=1 Tax=Mus musculus TaxID=10090 RepID=Q7TNN6_MOUSE|nr:uORF2 [Mus musculus]
MVGASRQPSAQGALVFFGFLRSLGFWRAGETLPLGLTHPAGPVAGIC